MQLRRLALATSAFLLAACYGREKQAASMRATKKPGPMPRWVAFITGPNAPDPGHETNASVKAVAPAAAAAAAAGDYLLICFLPDANDGKPHFMKGMMQTVNVS